MGKESQKSKIKSQKSKVRPGSRSFAFWLSTFFSSCKIASYRWWRLASADRNPKNIVQLVVIHAVLRAEVHARRARGGSGLLRIALLERDPGLLRGEGGNGRGRLERGVHRTGAGVEMRHRVQTQDQFHRAQHRGGVV